jgi:ribosomal-protein-serine acetyltransferase
MLDTTRPSTRLRPIEEKHVFDLFRLIEANQDNLAPWLPWVEDHQTIEDTLFMIQRALGQYTRGEGLLAGIWHQETLVGMVGHEYTDMDNASAQVTIWLDERYRRRGIALRALRSFVRHSFEDMGFKRLEFRCATHNTRAMILAERLGCVREGTLRGALQTETGRAPVAIYGLLPNDLGQQEGH